MRRLTVALTLLLVALLMPTTASAKLSVTTLSAITANLGTVTAGSISGVTISAGGSAVVLNTSGISITNGAAAINQIKWNDGSVVYSAGGSLGLRGTTSVSLMAAGSSLDWVGSNSLVAYNNSSLGTAGNPWAHIYVSTAHVGAIVAFGNTGLSTSFGIDDIGCAGSGRRSLFFAAGILYANPCQ